MTAAFEAPGAQGLCVRPWAGLAPDPARLLGHRAEHAMVLSSGRGDPRLTQWSYGALEPCAQADSLESARLALEGWAVPRSPGLPPFFGGAVGYISYDQGWAYAPRPRIPRADPLDMPGTQFHLYDAVYAKNEQTGEGWLMCQNTSEAQSRLRNLQRALSESHSPCTGSIKGALGPGVTEKTHKARLREVLDFIASGEIYQANLTYPLLADFEGAPEAAFLRLLQGQPPPFASFLGLGKDTAIVSASPECFLHLDPWTGELSTYPIKGTARRSADPLEDAQLAKALSADPKERAEHVMIVDLMRNDLGRLARPGDVWVDGLAYVESFATVHHLTSRVACKLPASVQDKDLLQALFPGGSITGAPKLRAMEIIDGLEDAPRGLYTGAIGYLTPDGGLMTSIAIRTAQISQGELRFGVGGGIVADSNAEREWQETQIKAQALARALRS